MHMPQISTNHDEMMHALDEIKENIDSMLDRMKRQRAKIIKLTRINKELNARLAANEALAADRDKEIASLEIEKEWFNICLQRANMAQPRREEASEMATRAKAAEAEVERLRAVIAQHESTEKVVGLRSDIPMGRFVMTQQERFRLELAQTKARKLEKEKEFAETLAEFQTDTARLNRRIDELLSDIGKF